MHRLKVPAAYQVPTVIDVQGATAPDGRPYVRIAASGKRAWLARAAFAGSGQEALSQLKTFGIPLLPGEWTRAKKLVAALTDFPIRALISHLGWSGSHFALADGSVFSPLKSEGSVVLFPPDKQRVKKAGSMQAWRDLTAELHGQHVATFGLMTAFAGPLIALSGYYSNVGFEIAGPGGTGKSTILRLAAAVCGPVDNAEGLNYWMTANATMNGFERVLTEHQDMSLIIDETNLFAAADNVALRAAKFNELIFKLADGTEKRRHHSPTPARSRFIFLTSTNEPLAQLLEGYRVHVADAAADRLLTIPIDAQREFGIFDWLPKKWPDAAALADFISTEVCKTYGVGIRRFLQRLVQERNADPVALQTRIRDAMDEFRSKIGVDKNNGSETRVADSFGLVMAAGVLAVKYGAISKELDPVAAAMQCYILNRNIKYKVIDRVKKLRELADDFFTPIIHAGNMREMTDEELEECPGVLWQRLGGVQELLLTSNQLLRAFPDLTALFADHKVRDILISEDGRRKTKRRIRTNRREERFYVFRMLPPI